MNHKKIKKINKYTCLILIFILATLMTTQASAQVDSSFNYQGELQDNNAPANDSYDFLFNLTDSDGFPFGDPSEHLNTDVVNGLFSLNVDFNIDAYDGFGDVSFSIEVRKTSDGGAYTSMGSQTIQSVPLATSLTNGDAMTGEVLTFNGFQWAPQTPAGSSSPWNLDGQGQISYTNGKVVINNNAEVSGKLAIGSGTNTHKLTIQAGADDKALRLIGDAGTVGFGARLNFGDGEFAYIDEPTDDDLTIHANDIVMDGDIKQPIDENGAIKYMVHASCGDSGSNIVKAYNGVDAGAITIADNALNAGRCTITFPANISNRYIQVSALFGVPGRAATCAFSADELRCTRFNPSTLTGANGEIMVLVY